MIIHKMHELAGVQNLTPGYFFEATVQEIYQDILRAGDTAIDVGANMGRHLFPMAEAVGPKGRILAFEPIPDLYDKLKDRTSQEKLSQIKLFRMAAAQARGTSGFSLFRNRPAFSGLKQRTTPFSAEEGGLTAISVDTCRLDDKKPWFRKVKLIKLDIEGGEYHALVGAASIMATSRPVIVLENGLAGAAQIYGYSRDDFFRLFRDREYRIFRLDGVELDEAMWADPGGCWEWVAYPCEQAHLSERLPRHCNAAIDKLMAQKKQV